MNLNIQNHACDRVEGCASSVAGQECSGHGACLDGVCTCDADWMGPACSLPVCPNSCSGKGECDHEEHRCKCFKGYNGNPSLFSPQVRFVSLFLSFHSFATVFVKSNHPCDPTGSDCSQVIDNGWWEVVGHDGTSRMALPGPEASLLQRSSHTAVLIGDSIWVLGGYSFVHQPFIMQYQITGKC